MSGTGATPYASRRRRPRVLRWVFLALLVVPVVEIAAIIAVGRVIGGWQTLLLLILESLLGAWIVKREGSRTWTALQEALREMGLDDVESLGYCFQTDLTWRAVKHGLTVVEVPITFVEREVGDSKMSPDIMKESLRRITSWGVRHRARQVRDLVGGTREPRWHTL